MGTQTDLKNLATSAKSARDNVVDGNASSITASMSPKTAYSKNITIEEWNQLVVNSTAILQNEAKERDFSTSLYNWVTYLNSLPYISNVSVAVASGTSSQYLSVSRADAPSTDNNGKASTFTLTFDDTVLNTQFDTLRSNLATLSETVTTSYLTKADAYSTYLTKADAVASYLSKIEAASTYATVGDLDECLKLETGDIVYSQSRYQFSINGDSDTENLGWFTFNVYNEDMTISASDGMTLTVNVDFVERDANGVITHLDWPDIETKSHAAGVYAPQTTTYTKAEVNNLISGLHSLSFSVVSELPATGSSNIIYLVPNSGSAPNIYDEYVWLATSQAYERLGSTDIDLSGYLKIQAGNLAYQQDTTAFRIWNGESGYITLKPSSGLDNSSIFLGNATNSNNKVYLSTNSIRYTVNAGASWTTLEFTNLETKIATANTYVPKTRTINNKALSADIVLNKSDVGLNNVDNTSDLSKPISTATQTALNAKQDTLVSGTNIKTMNGQSLLGSGNIAIEVESIPDSDIAAIFANLDPTAIYSVLENNTWDVIKAVCEAGIAANYWSVGDTKTDVGTDGKTRTFRIVDMQGLYGKHVVFEQVELENTDYQWNPSSNVDGENCYHNYSISKMRTTHLPAILAKYSDSLQGVIKNTKYQVATNGNNGTLLELEDKLFLPAEREIFSSRSHSRTEEWNALTRFQLYAANDTSTFRKKYKPGATSATYWWLRSPYSGITSHVCSVKYDGYADDLYADDYFGVSPFFSF